ncbi:MAG: NAD(P)-dependent oxidoreductase [Bacteroidales bacterium]|nr:NAD(P)-dependent oxidoreductase [Bacteroidales bacterium]
MKKTTIFLTGATGNMGWAGFQELYERRDRFHIKLLVRDSRKNRTKLARYIGDPSVTVVWGDLTRYQDVLEGVTGADYVLHVGGMVSPAADYYPEKTLKVNVLAAENVAKAVLVQSNADDIKVVYIGSVAQNGDRRSPNHWGRTGDPVCASRFDMYSVSKCKAEKAIVDSGIRKWVSLRQSGILYPGILKVLNPTAFHVPVQGVLEWVTIEDSGRLLANVCEDWVPEEFWNRFYNISSGEQYRMTNYEFESRLLNGLGLPGPEKVFEPQWFATRNFHGMWYTDADVLEDYLHFRANIPVDRYFADMKSKLPWFYSLAFLAPAWAVRLFMKPFAFEKGMGTQWWVDNDPEKLDAYYGSRQAYEEIRSWEQMRPAPMEKNAEAALAAGELKVLDHGWDESLSLEELTVEQVQKAAEFRGGRFLGKKGRTFEWECEHGHRFEASLEYVLLGGGWCLECNPDKWESETTSRNRFVSQLK